MSWIELKEGEVPDLSASTLVTINTFDGDSILGEAGIFDWSATGEDRIVKYRVWRPDKVNDAGEDTNCSIDSTLEQRGNRYGTFKGHSELSQRLSGAIRYHCIMNDKNLSDVHTEALSMICHKIARIVNGDPNYDDSWRDIAGYATLVVKHLNGEDI